MIQGKVDIYVKKFLENWVISVSFAEIFAVYQRSNGDQSIVYLNYVQTAS